MPETRLAVVDVDAAETLVEVISNGAEHDVVARL